LQEFLAGAHLAGGGGLVGGTQNDVENDVAEGKMHCSCRRLHLTGSVSLNFEVFLISGEVESQKYNQIHVISNISNNDHLRLQQKRDSF